MFYKGGTLINSENYPKKTNVIITRAASHNKICTQKENKQILNSEQQLLKTDSDNTHSFPLKKGGGQLILLKH